MIFPANAVKTMLHVFHCRTLVSPANSESDIFSHQFYQNEMKPFDSLEALDPLGVLLAHLVLEIQVLQVLPERKTDNYRKRQIEFKGHGKEKDQSVHMSWWSAMKHNAENKQTGETYNGSRGSLLSLWSIITWQTLQRWQWNTLGKHLVQLPVGYFVQSLSKGPETFPANLQTKRTVAL